jgi:hypothetical protein
MATIPGIPVSIAELDGRVTLYPRACSGNSDPADLQVSADKAVFRIGAAPIIWVNWEPVGGGRSCGNGVLLQAIAANGDAVEWTMGIVSTMPEPGSIGLQVPQVANGGNLRLGLWLGNTTWGHDDPDATATLEVEVPAP